MMKITVLGNCGPYPRAGGACSGYLLEEGETKILIDCGNGTLSRLQQKINSFYDIDLIILSHLHSDHVGDAMVLKYALGIGKMKDPSKKSILLYAPQSPADDFEKLQYQQAYDLHGIHEALVIQLENLEITFKKMDHPVECYGVKVKSNDRTFVYSADTKYCSQLLDFTREADMLLCECGVLEKDKNSDTPHLSAKETGMIGRQCNIKNVLLTHFWPEYDLQDVFEEANAEHPDKIVLSEEMKSYEI
ncbi:MAG: MBL fold metallo-hydrolase [Bacillota bacterium]